MGIFVPKAIPEVVLKRFLNIVPDHQICEIIELLDSVETILLKYIILNI